MIFLQTKMKTLQFQMTSKHWQNHGKALAKRNPAISWLILPSGRTVSIWTYWSDAHTAIGRKVNEKNMSFSSFSIISSISKFQFEIYEVYAYWLGLTLNNSVEIDPIQVQCTRQCECNHHHKPIEGYVERIPSVEKKQKTFNHKIYPKKNIIIVYGNKIIYKIRSWLKKWMKLVFLEKKYVQKSMINEIRTDEN